MNRTLIDNASEALLLSGLAFRSTDISTRIKQEETGLKRLRYRDDFLGSYDEVIRYMFILCLRKGFDIRQDRVHPALRIFLNTFLMIDHGNISDIITARHALKYKGCRPSMRIRMLLSCFQQDLSLLYETNIDIYGHEKEEFQVGKPCCCQRFRKNGY
jgi:hypothetical protein